MKVWVVEDDRKVREFLVNALRCQGYAVEQANTLAGLKDLVDGFDPATPPALLILDRLLGAEDTATYLPEIRERLPQAGVLFLSALADPKEKAKLINSGADDYLAKPFALDELLARAMSILRRNTLVKASPLSQIEYRDLRIDILAHRVFCGQAAIDLSQKEYRLLSLFVERPGRVLSRFQMLDLVWETQFDVESNVVESTIKNLRRKLREGGSSVEILNERGVGYWIES